jgi:hypothetical protein
MIFTLHAGQSTWTGTHVLFNPCADYTVGSATGQTFLVNGLLSEIDNPASPTGGVFHLCNEIV